MFSILKYAVVFCAGGLLYGALEILFRARTHWSMMVAGGICAVFLYLIAVKNNESVWKKWVMGGMVITTIEFVTGIIVNVVLGWHVWSYESSWANLFGQICLLFSLLWILLSIPGIWLMALIERHIFNNRIFKDYEGGKES